MSFPLIRLEGDAFSQGVQHGITLKDRVLHNLELYFYRFENEIKLTRAQTLEMAGKVAGHIESFNPDYAAGMRGTKFSVLTRASLAIQQVARPWPARLDM